MTSPDPYLIPGTEKPEARQLAEHPTVEKRAKKALTIASVSVAIAVLAAVFGFLQWLAANRQANIADRALKLAEKSAQDQASDIERSRQAAESSAAAASELARSNASMAETMRGQLGASKKELGVMQRQFETTDRPWVKVLGAKGARLTFMGPSFPNTMGMVDEAWTNIRFDIRNVGRSVATQIRVRSTLVLPVWGKDPFPIVVKAEQKKLCDAIEEGKGFSGEPDTVIFPDESYDAGNGSGVNLTDHVSYVAGVSVVVPVVVGCVDYQFQSSPEHHQTRFVYEYFHSDGDHSRFFLIGHDVPTEGLLLIRNPQDDYAN